MIDNWGRKIEYLRVSITDRCNLRCIYCMPKDGIELIKHDEILTFEELIRIIKSASELGISKIRITGGEPLARKGITQFIRKIKSIKGIEEVSITTNGILLEENIDDLIKAGLDRINVSIDSLNEDIYSKITRSKGLDKVLRGINVALDKGIKKVKINTVIAKEINYSEIMDFAELTEKMPVDVRFIELMPIGEGKKYTQVSNDDIKKIILKKRKLIPFLNSKGSGPATYFRTLSSKGAIGFISPISHEFCNKCNRIRITPEGFLKLCLHWNDGVDLKKVLRSKASDEQLYKIIYNAIKQKPYKHEFKSQNKNSDSRNMSQIGG
ncbi:MAG: GTP 3',8-cyclase MoaA [Tepidibacter sp.]|jgi:cyclic pyranopterin phosphate synthase|uniref:GTP 3',8-cyclase MoaA n=1 Tax=Tepidibacter sp. TaxID=2529387 RepID=UPI0025D39DCB|nr:GTP 3',8-cyclase MoaA [Tepidibacter sp.]MCT4507624.1 GTP 3',8-cyclase MoaA [Tepidibacter sp.]